MKTENETPEERSEKAETLHAMRSYGRIKQKADILTTLRDIKDNGAKRFKGTFIDSFSASAFCAVYDAIKDESNRKKLLDIAERDIVRAISICFKLIK